MININSPILPWESIGDIGLYSTIKELREIIENRRLVSGVLLNNMWVRYEIKDTLYLFFHLGNGKLFKITALKEYKGMLFDKIGIGTYESDITKLEPSFLYDDFEEIYESEKGVFIETDPVEKTVTQISVFIKELDDENFEDANW